MTAQARLSYKGAKHAWSIVMPSIRRTQNDDFGYLTSGGPMN